MLTRFAIGVAFLATLATVAGLIYVAGQNAERAAVLAAENAAIEAKRDTLLRATVRSRKDAEKREAAIASAKVEADRLAEEYRAARTRVRVVRDTVYVAGEPPIVSPAVADVITSGDAAIAAKDSLIVQLGTTLAWYQVQVAKRDTIIALDSAIIANLERRQAGSRCGRRCGIAIGAGSVLAAVLVTAKFADISRAGR